MLKATNGNLELMEAMLVLNCLDFGGESINIGRIDVINPAFSSKQNEFSATWANNKELRYCWNKLNELKPIESDDRFKEGKIKLVSSVENCYRTFKEIMDLSAGGHEHKKLKEYDYAADYCLPVGPTLDANGGQFANGEKTRFKPNR